MKSISQNVTCLKVIFSILLLLILSYANGISIEFQDGLQSETINSHQIIPSHSGIQYYILNHQKPKDEKSYNLVTTPTVLTNSEIQYYVPQQQRTKVEVPNNSIPSSTVFPNSEIQYYSPDQQKPKAEKSQATPTILTNSEIQYYVPDQQKTKVDVPYNSIPSSTVLPNSEIHHYVGDQQKTKVEKPYNSVQSSTILPPNYKYTVAYIGQSTKSVHDKPECNSQPKVASTASQNYVQQANIIPHYIKEEAKQYKYGYRVTDPHKGADFGHSETHDGSNVKGYYHVVLPDGRLQTVEYWAGPSGYHAFITYDATVPKTI